MVASSFYCLQRGFSAAHPNRCEISEESRLDWRSGCREVLAETVEMTGVER
jgi:hypothetical protein